MFLGDDRSPRGGEFEVNKVNLVNGTGREDLIYFVNFVNNCLKKHQFYKYTDLTKIP